MWLDRAQMFLAALGVALGAAMVVFGAMAGSWSGLLLIIVGVVVYGNGVWFVFDARRRMGRRPDERREPGSTERWEEDDGGTVMRTRRERDLRR